MKATAAWRQTNHGLMPLGCHGAKSSVGPNVPFSRWRGENVQARKIFSVFSRQFSAGPSPPRSVTTEPALRCRKAILEVTIQPPHVFPGVCRRDILSQFSPAWKGETGGKSGRYPGRLRLRVSISRRRCRPCIPCQCSLERRRVDSDRLMFAIPQGDRDSTDDRSQCRKNALKATLRHLKHPLIRRVPLGVHESATGFQLVIASRDQRESVCRSNVGECRWSFAPSNRHWRFPEWTQPEVGSSR